jgi:hypothetical protein
MRWWIVFALACACERKVTIAIQPVKPSVAPSASAAPIVEASTPNEERVTFSEAAKSFDFTVGTWSIGEEMSTKNPGLWVDGSNVHQDAFYPLATYTGAPVTKGHISVRFYPENGKLDQAAGIAFGIRTDGTYYGVRANALENNMLVFKVVHGQRTVLKTIGNATTTTRAWHTLEIDIEGKNVSASLDGASKLESMPLDGDVTGSVGLWSKADSRVLFDDFTVARR